MPKIKSTKKSTRQPSTVIAIDTPVDVVVVDAPATITAPSPIMVDAIAIADAIALPDGFVVPAYIGAFVTAIRAIAPMPSTTRDERAACVSAFVASMERSMPGVPMPSAKNIGRFSGNPVFESQNAIYVACVLANVAVTNGHVMAAWRGELPNAKCDFLAKNYAWSTCSDYVNGRHGGSFVSGAREFVGAWHARGHKPA